MSTFRIRLILFFVILFVTPIAWVGGTIFSLWNLCTPQRFHVPYSFNFNYSC